VASYTHTAETSPAESIPASSGARGNIEWERRITTAQRGHSGETCDLMIHVDGQFRRKVELCHKESGVLHVIICKGIGDRESELRKAQFFLHVPVQE
jgi:hypothetical protein